MHVITDPKAPVKPLTEVERAFAAAAYKLLRHGRVLNGQTLQRSLRQEGAPIKQVSSLVEVDGEQYVVLWKAREMLGLSNTAFAYLKGVRRWKTLVHPERRSAKVMRLQDLKDDLERRRLGIRRMSTYRHLTSQKRRKAYRRD